MVNCFCVPSLNVKVPEPNASTATGVPSGAVIVMANPPGSGPKERQANHRGPQDEKEIQSLSGQRINDHGDQGRGAAMLAKRVSQFGWRMGDNRYSRSGGMPEPLP